MKFILFQIDHTNQTMTNLAVAQGTAGIDVVVDFMENMPAQIGAHCTIDSCNVLIEIFAVEINFRHNHIQGRGFCFDKSFYLMPILRLRSILVAGNDTPSGEVLYIRNQDIAFGKTGTVHGCVPPKS